MASVKIHMPQGDAQMGGNAYIGSFNRLGLQVEPVLRLADHVLPLTDRGAYAVAGHPSYMSKEALDIVLLRERLGETGLPTIPTFIVNSPEEAPQGMLVKLRNSADPSAGYAVQPHLGFPQIDLDISFAVNQDGDILDFANLSLLHYEAKKPGVNAMADQADVDMVLPGIKEACKLLDIRGGIHNVQFLKYEGQWCLTDWNPRPAFVHTQGLAATHPYFDEAIAFMVGMQHEPKRPFFLTKPYWGSPIPFTLEGKIRRLGLVPRRVSGINEGFPRVSGVGDTEAEVLAKFEEMEKLL